MCVLFALNKLRRRFMPPNSGHQKIGRMRAAILLMTACVGSNGSLLAQEREPASRDNVSKMLSAINEIRSARDIKLDCGEHVDRYLGHGDTIKHYVDQFSSHGIQPQRHYNPPKHYTYFQITSKLREIPRS